MAEVAKMAEVAETGRAAPCRAEMAVAMAVAMYKRTGKTLNMFRVYRKQKHKMIRSSNDNSQYLSDYHRNQNWQPGNPHMAQVWNFQLRQCHMWYDRRIEYWKLSLSFSAPYSHY